MEKTPPMAKDDTTEDSSEDPKYRPPLAGGGNNNSSRDEDSELKCPYSLSNDGGESGNWGFWADHEDNITTIVKQTPTPPIENKFIGSGSCATPVKFPSGYQRCIGCKYLLKQTTLYCNSCWKNKKYWLLPPPKFKLSQSKIKAARQKRTEQRDNNRIKSDDTLSGSTTTTNEKCLIEYLYFFR